MDIVTPYYRCFAALCWQSGVCGSGARSAMGCGQSSMQKRQQQRELLRIKELEDSINRLESERETLKAKCKLLEEKLGEAERKLKESTEEAERGKKKVEEERRAVKEAMEEIEKVMQQKKMESLEKTQTHDNAEIKQKMKEKLAGLRENALAIASCLST